MALWSPWFSREAPRKSPKSVNIFLGFFFLVNFCLGTGFLGIPYAFFYTGFLAAVPTLLLIAFVSWNTATWEVEVMARAQAVESYMKAKSSLEASDSDSNSEREEIYSWRETVDGDRTHPQFEIRLTRKFEPTELCEVFFNKWVKFLYLFIMTIYCFLAGWSFTTVAGSAWASNIPLNFGTLSQCDGEAFQHALIPENEGCRNAYRFCLFLFGVIVIPFSLLDLKEQAIVQMILGLLRFLTIGAIVLYSIVKLIEGGDPCTTQYEPFLNFTNQTIDSFNLSVATETIDFLDVVVKFDWKGWIVAIPVFVYAYIVHQGIPALTHPIKQKQYLRWLMVWMFAIAAFAYLALGITASLWFRQAIQEIVTLNWVNFAMPGNSPQLRALSYYLIFFPSIDVSSAYPLIVHAITNNIYTGVFGRDTSEAPRYRYDWAIRYALKFVIATLPLIMGMFISNLVYVLKYAGLFGFAICFFFPIALQLKSQWDCKKLFGPLEVYRGNSYDVPESNADKMDKVNLSTSGTGGTKETVPLLSVQDEGKRQPSYMTPYSSRILSHPVTVVTLGVVASMLFLLALVGLGVHPEKLECVR